MKSDRDAIATAWAALEAAFDAVADLSYDVLAHRELVTMLERMEVLTRRLPAVERPGLTRLVGEASPIALGARNLREVLRTRLRISGAEAGRRLLEATQLGPAGRGDGPAVGAAARLDRCRPGRWADQPGARDGHPHHDGQTALLGGHAHPRARRGRSRHARPRIGRRCI